MRSIHSCSRRLGVVLVAIVLTIGACSSAGDPDLSSSERSSGATDSSSSQDKDEAPEEEVAPVEETTAEGDGAATPAVERPVLAGDAPLLPSGRVVPADSDGPTAELITLQDEPYIGAAVYPRPDYEGNPWSQWGQGITLDDGRVITAIGDHLGADGNSYLFVYDPETRAITRFADILSALDHQGGSWGYGKVHGQMVDGGDGGIYFSTYYGSRRNLTFDGSYEGDVLFRVDAQTLDLQPVVVPVPGFGVPSLAGDGLGHVYGEAVDPLLDDDTYPRGGFFVYDIAAGEVTLFDEDPQHTTFRNVLVGPDGGAFYARDGGGLFSYDPSTGSTSMSDIQLSDQLRASTMAASDGTVYGVTQRPTVEFFALDPDGGIDKLGNTELYTTSLALLPDESGFLFVPGAHGRTSQVGAPLISVDTKTGSQTTLVELADLVTDKLGVELGGTYSVTVDRERGLAHIGFNAGPAGDPWGEVVFVVVELP